MKATIYLTALISIISLTTAAPTDNPQGDPGFFGASHPLHGVEVVTDNLAVSFGFANASEVAQERLAEANQAATKGRVKAQEKAMKQFNKIASKARNIGDNGDIQGLLEQIQLQTPENASQGLNNVLEQAGNLTKGVDVNMPGQSLDSGNPAAGILDQVSQKGKSLIK